MAVSGLLAEELRRGVFGADNHEPVIATKAPAAGVPLDASSDVASEECFSVGDAEAAPLKEAQAADAAGRVGHDRAVGRNGHNEVAAVIQQVRRSDAGGRQVAELQIL